MKKKSFFKKLFNNIDKKLEKKSKECSCEGSKDKCCK